MTMRRTDSIGSDTARWSTSRIKTAAELVSGSSELAAAVVTRCDPPTRITLNRNWGKVAALAETLLEYRTLNGDVVREILTTAQPLLRPRQLSFAFMQGEL